MSNGLTSMHADDDHVRKCRNTTYTWHRCTSRVSWNSLIQRSSNVLFHQVLRQLLLAWMLHAIFLPQLHRCMQPDIVSKSRPVMHVSIEHEFAVGL